MAGRLIATVDGPVGRITFSNPARMNAVSQSMWAQIPEALQCLEHDAAVRVIAVTGDGGKAFVSGADISEFDAARGSAEQEREYDRVAQQAFAAFARVSKPTVACIDGYCIGGGVAVALACDLRIASEQSQFGIPAARLGLGYDLPGVRKLVGVVGPAHAREIFYTARRYRADEALRMGLVNQVYANAQFAESARAYIDGIAANAPLTLRAVKRTVDELLRDESQRDVAAVEQLVARCFDSQDYAEGRRAFMEKRVPRFRGA